MFLLLVAALSGTVVNGRLYDRIVGGSECEPNSQPWQVSIHHAGTHKCGGVLIDENWVLTAAHCELADSQIRLGEHNIKSDEGTEQFTTVVKSCSHPYYNSYTYTYDIMLLKLATPATLNEYVQTIDIGCTALPDGTSCRASGWGSTTSPIVTYPDLLHCVDVETLPISVCRKAHPDDQIQDNTLCVGILEGGKDTCKGDSGGPLVCDSKLYGITSWGSLTCGAANEPAIYTKVCDFQKWIKTTIEKDKCLPYDF